jgi:hypothetical protein
MIDPLTPFVFPFPAAAAHTNHALDASAVPGVPKRIADSGRGCSFGRVPQQNAMSNDSVT